MILTMPDEIFTKMYNAPSKTKTIEKQNNAAKIISEVFKTGPLLLFFENLITADRKFTLSNYS